LNNAKPAKKAPVIILTGFLGAGKTTLLNRILTADHGRRIAVIVNEFGEVGVDHHLLLASDQEVVQMNNGCICCTVRGDLVRALFQLLEHRAAFDTVVIETTGLAEPAPVAQTLYVDEAIRREFTLAGVVTVVDAKHIAGQIDASEEAREQISFADLLLLNKTDLSTPQELDELEQKISGLNAIAKICRSRNADVDLAAVLEPAHADLAQRIEDAVAAHHSGHHHHLHVSTVCIVEPGALDGLKVSMWFRSLIAECGPDMLRMKGILNLRGDADQFLFQGVQTELEGRPGRAWAAGEERINRLVFIGRKLDRDKIADGFMRCFFDAAEDGAAPPDPFGRRNLEVSPFTLDQIRYWMRQNFGFPNDAAIVIKEVPCVKPGCPPIETSIMAVLKHEPPRLFKVQRTINEITFDNIYDLIENPMPCC
jgi:G3E family GTPase